MTEAPEDRQPAAYPPPTPTQTSTPKPTPTPAPTHASPAVPAEPTGHSTGHPTGHPTVDEVLASVQGLQDRPASDHVAVFEAAHDRLRAALADAGGSGPGL